MHTTASLSPEPDLHNAPAGWTFADLVSTYRYWALFIAYTLILVAALPAMAVVFPFSYMLSSNDYIAGNTSSIVIVGIMAIAVPPRYIKWVLIFLALLGAIAILCLRGAISYLPDLPTVPLRSSGLYFPALILTSYFFASKFPLTVLLASPLMSARSSRADFISAFSLLVTVPVLSFEFCFWTLPTDSNSADAYARTMPLFMLACFVCAALVLLLARPLSFDAPPPVRHAPLAYRRRAAAGVTLFALLPLLVFVFILFLSAVTETRLGRGGFVLLAGVLALCSLAYTGYWCYRIHGELAGQAPSRHLLTPVAATVMAVLVPLALPIQLITLGRLMNTRGATVSIGWLTFWSLFMPPIAMGMIQSAVNAK